MSKVFEHGMCRRCDFSTDLAGVTNDDAPPCTAYDTDAAESIVVAVAKALGVELVDDSPQLDNAVEAVKGILADYD
jgi:hypothetical protein